jgi:hypothetical protein
MVNQTKQKIMTNKLEEDNTNDAIQGKENNNKVSTSITIKLQL